MVSLDRLKEDKLYTLFNSFIIVGLLFAMSREKIIPPLLAGLLLLSVITVVYGKYGKEKEGERPGRKTILMSLAVILVLLALLLPSISLSAGVNPNIMLVMDRSTSMDLKDIEISRLLVSKLAAITFLDHADPSDKVGLVVFCKTADKRQSLTVDKVRVKQRIIEFRTCGSTAIGEGIKLASLELENANRPRIIILIADGASNSGIDPLEALEEYAMPREVVIYSISLGTERDGEFNPDLLKTIASRTGGKYYHASTVEELLNIYLELPGEINKVNLFKGFLLGALFIALLNIVLMLRVPSKSE